MLYVLYLVILELIPSRTMFTCTHYTLSNSL